MAKKYRIDDLQINGLRLKQSRELFCFGVDAVLLANYAAKFIKKEHKVMDLGCGNGIIAVLLSAKCDAERIDGLELNEESVALAQENIILNGLQNRLNIVWGDMRNDDCIPHPTKYDVVLSNPPYIKHSDGKVNEKTALAAAKHELTCTLAQVLACGQRLLKAGGSFVMIHRTQRLAEIVQQMKQHGIEPKELLLIYPKEGKKSNLFMIRGVKGAKEWIDVLPPLFIYDKENQYTAEFNDFCHKNQPFARR